MTQMKSTIFGIVEVHGYAGFWLRRKPVHFRIGTNCTRIQVDGDTLTVYDGYSAVATAPYRPLADVDSLTSDFRWDRVMKRPGDHER